MTKSCFGNFYLLNKTRFIIDRKDVFFEIKEKHMIIGLKILFDVLKHHNKKKVDSKVTPQ